MRLQDEVREAFIPKPSRERSEPSGFRPRILRCSRCRGHFSKKKRKLTPLCSLDFCEPVDSTFPPSHFFGAAFAAP